MESMTPALWIEAIGWLASGLTVLTYAMNTMLLLRIFAVSSTVFFLIYGTILHIWPLVGMDAVLLPINLYRLWQLLTLRRKVRNARSGDRPDFSIAERYGKKHRFPAGETVFKRGDSADALFYIADGSVLIEEAGVTLGPGEIFGEMGFFTARTERTATVRTLSDVTVHALSEAQFLRLQFEDPGFGMAVMRTITQRLIAREAAQATPQRVAE